MSHQGLGASGLSVSIERLDKAVAAIESRILALKARSEAHTEPNLSPDTPPQALAYQRLMEDLKEAKAREAELKAAAEAALEALSVAGGTIRMILSTQGR